MNFDPKISTIIAMIEHSSKIDEDVKNKILIMLGKQRLQSRTSNIRKRKRRRKKNDNLGTIIKKSKLNNGTIKKNPIIIHDAFFNELSDINDVSDIKTDGPSFGDVFKVSCILLKFTKKKKNKGVRFLIMMHLEKNTTIINNNLFDFLMGECSAIIHDAKNSFVFRYYNEIKRIECNYDNVLKGLHKYSLSFVDQQAKKLVQQFKSDSNHERMIRLSHMFTWSDHIAMRRSTVQYDDKLSIGLFARKKGLRINKNNIYNLGYYEGAICSLDENSPSQYKITLSSDSNKMIDGFKNGEITCRACLYNHRCTDYQIEFQEDDHKNIKAILIANVSGHEEIFTNYSSNYFESLECMCRSENCISND